MPFNIRRLDAWLTIFFAVFAVGTWAFHGLQAAFADDPLSTKALFVWLAAAMAGWAAAITLVIFTAPLRTRRRQSDPARTTWDMNYSTLTMGIYFLGAGTSPIYDLSAGTWDWSWLVMSALVGAFVLGTALLVWGEWRLQAAAPGPHEDLGRERW